MQLPAPMHLWRSTRARMAISATHRREPAERERCRLGAARSPELGEQVREAADHVVLGEAELGGDLGVRPTLGQELEQVAFRVVEARGPRRPAADPSGEPAAASGLSASSGPASSTSSRPTGPVSHRTRIVSSAVPWAIRDSVVRR